MGGNSGARDESVEWHDDMERYFLEILGERVQRDQHGSPVFKSRDWTEMGEQIFMKFAVRFPIEKLKAKYFRMRTTHTKFNELISTTGVTWDSNSGIVFANEEVWDDFFKRDKIFKTFKRKGCKLFNLMSVVFSTSTAIGTFHHASTAAPVTSEEEHRLEDAYIGVNVESTQTSSQKRKSSDNLEPSTGGRRVRRSAHQETMDSVMSQWSRTLKAREDRYRAESTSFESDIDRVMEILNAIPGLSYETFNKALNKLHDPYWRRTFMLMKEDHRIQWIASLDA